MPALQVPDEVGRGEQQPLVDSPHRLRLFRLYGPCPCPTAPQIVIRLADRACADPVLDTRVSPTADGRAAAPPRAICCVAGGRPSGHGGSSLAHGSSASRRASRHGSLSLCASPRAAPTLVSRRLPNRVTARSPPGLTVWRLWTRRERPHATGTRISGRRHPSTVREQCRNAGSEQSMVGCNGGTRGSTWSRVILLLGSGGRRPSWRGARPPARLGPPLSSLVRCGPAAGPHQQTSLQSSTARKVGEPVWYLAPRTVQPARAPMSRA